MVKGIEINKNQLRKKIGCILGSEINEDDFNYKNIIRAYLGDEMILIRCNMNQIEWDRFCLGKLTKKELLKIT